MALTLTLDGNLLIQLTEDARPIAVPLKFSGTYTEKVLYDFNFASSQSHVAAPQGSVTAPRFIVVWVQEGTVEFSWDSAGANPTIIGANPTPPPAESPLMVIMRYAPGAGQLYLTCSGPARGRLWIFE